MNLLIEDMDIPSSCQSCKLKHFVGNRVLSGCKPEVLYECPFCDGLFTLDNKRQSSCKFKQLPTSHGRLIDADVLMELLEKSVPEKNRGHQFYVFRHMLRTATTIIEAEE